MQTFRWLAGLVMIGCGSTNHGFPDAGTQDDSGTTSGDAGCLFCGSEAGPPSDGWTCVSDPANFDIPNNGCDDDGDGIVDNAPGLCDKGLPTMSPSATQLSEALGICPPKGDTWGVTVAKYTQGVGSLAVPDPHQYGTIATFGTNVPARQGSAIGILSTGVAADYDCNSAQFKGSVCTSTGQGNPPPGYPRPAGSCTISNIANDVMDLELQIKVPANAKGFTFDFSFYSGEWPEWVCTTFNDSFVAWLTSSAWAGNKLDAGTTDFNISFDPKNDPVSVNNAFFQACSPANATVGCSGGGTLPPDPCTLGNKELQGTGFFSSTANDCGQHDSGGGATGWLTTTAPVKPGETITLQLMVWNTGDQAYDSTVLLDNWNWVATDTTVNTSRPPN